jgi:hypothetical protein
MKPVDLARKLRREAAFEPAALDPEGHRWRFHQRLR